MQEIVIIIIKKFKMLAFTDLHLIFFYVLFPHFMIQTSLVLTSENEK